MDAWATDQKVDQSPKGLLTMMADPTSTLTKALGLELVHPGPQAPHPHPHAPHAPHALPPHAPHARPPPPPSLPPPLPPQGKGLVNRCKRFALYAENGVVKSLQASQGGDLRGGHCTPPLPTHPIPHPPWLRPALR